MGEGEWVEGAWVEGAWVEGTRRRKHVLNRNIKAALL